MKLTDVRNVFKMLCETELLDEAMAGEFTFGFELEGCCTAPEDADGEYFYLPGYHSGERPRGGAKVLFNQLNDELGFGEGKIERDGSLNPSFNKGGWTFEYASPVIKFNPKNVEKMYSFLKKLPDFNVYTNDSCGFHTHLSFPEISRNDAAWITICCSLDKSMYKELTSFEKESGDTIDFFGGYAKPDRLRHIERAIKDNNMDDLKSYLDDTKYTVLRLHPDHGTLEWRGPRNFMNEGKIEDIHRYILKLYRVAQKMATYSRMSSYTSGDTGLSFTKEKVAKLGINSSEYHYNFHSEYENKIKEKTKNLIKAFTDGRVSLNSMSPKQMDILFKQGNSKVSQKINSLFNNELEELKKFSNEKFQLILDYYKRYTGDSLASIANILLSKDFDISSKISSFQKETIIDELVTYILHRRDITSLFNTLTKLVKIYKPFESKKFEEEIKNINNVDIKTVLFLLNTCKDKIPYDIIEKIWKLLLEPNRIHYFSWIDEIPVNIQRKLVRKNPFNIQYIKNPDSAIVNWVLSKEPEAKNYMLGGI